MFAGSDHRESVLHSLTKRGLYWRFTAIVSLSQGRIVFSHPIFAQLEAGISHALFFVACDANPDIREIPDAMRIKGYSPSEAANQSLQQQVHCKVDTIKGEDIPGRLVISEAMLHRIANVDDTAVSLDCSKTNACGRPAISFHDPHFLLTQRPAAKSSLSCTGIFGSNAAGECVRIHWQLPTAATSEDREKLRFDFLRHVSITRGRFGCEEERVWPCTIGMNEKGGMNDEEFDKYIDNSIVPLYPDLEDTQGKRVLLKVDSGLGRNGRDR